jgi:hypothetical protein
MGIELFDGFKEVLIDMALTNWEDLVMPHANVDKTVAHFEQTLVQEMYQKYVGAEQGILKLSITKPCGSQ